MNNPSENISSGFRGGVPWGGGGCTPPGFVNRGVWGWVQKTLLDPPLEIICTQRRTVIENETLGPLVEMETATLWSHAVQR